MSTKDVACVLLESSGILSAQRLQAPFGGRLDYKLISLTCFTIGVKAELSDVWLELSIRRVETLETGYGV